MIEWLFLSHQPQRTITTYVTALCHLIIKWRERTQQLFRYDAAFIHIPLTQIYLQHLATQSIEFQCAIADCVGGLEINLMILERRWQRDMWEWSSLPLSTSETPS